MAPSNVAIDPKWKSWTVKRSGVMVVSQYCPDVPYLESEVPAGILKVRRIVFTTVSHDQGFSDSPEHLKGTYELSLSWFDAADIAPSGHDRVDRTRIQHNLNAVGTKKKHVNAWDYRTSQPDQKRFLRAIRSGDRICIVPKTRHLAWLNFVYGAEIQVYGEEEDAPSPLSLRVGSMTLDSVTTCDMVYRQLSVEKNGIRVITLEPGALDDEVACKVEYTQLTNSEHMSYEALSYCWGDAEDTRTVKISTAAPDGRGASWEGKILVTANLFEALKHLRRTDSARRLWADAVCINQLDNHERAHQVAMMPRIYTQAERVLVWLGEATKPVDETLHSLVKIGKRYSKAKHPEDSEAVRKEMHCPLLNESSLLLDTDVFDYDYFRRTWVLQEVFNGRKVSVLCGSHEIDWAQLIRLNRCLTKSMLIPNPVGKHVLPSLFAGLFELIPADVNNDMIQYTRLAGKLDILEVALRGLDLEASDPRDKLFALLTFGKETSVLDKLPSSIAPDYNKNVDEVFASFTRWWIERHHSLKILSAVHVAVDRTWQTLTRTPRETEALDRPTWSFWHTGKSFWARGTLGLSPELSYSASRRSKPDIDLLSSTKDQWILSLSGKRIDRIKSIRAYDYLQEWRHSEQCDKSHGCGRCAMHAAYKNLFDPLDEWGTWRYGVQHQTKDVVGALRRDNTQKEIREKLGDHLHAHWHVEETGALLCLDKCVLETENGSLGLCPPAARRGDALVLLYGGDVLYVLRPHGDQFYFVGECFLKGYMHGQGMGKPNADGKWEGEVFHLV